jgi:hypothetical protein
MEIKELLKKYKYYDKSLFEYYTIDGVNAAIEIADAIQKDCWSDSCETWKDMIKVKCFLYQQYILQNKKKS